MIGLITQAMTMSGDNQKPKIYNHPTITENGIYIVPAEYDGFGDIEVQVPKQGTLITPPTFTENNTYNASDYNADGFQSVTVNVPTGGGGGEFDINIHSESFESILGLTLLGERYTDGEYAFELRYGRLGGVGLSIDYTYGQDKTSWGIQFSHYSICYKNGMPMWAQSKGGLIKEYAHTYSGNEWNTTKFKSVDNIIYNNREYPRTSSNGVMGYATMIYNYYERQPPLVFEDYSYFYSGFIKTPNLSWLIYTNLSAEELVECYNELYNKYGAYN